MVLEHLWILSKKVCSFIEIALRNGCSPINLQHIFRVPFLKDTSGWLLLNLQCLNYVSQTFKVQKRDSIWTLVCKVKKQPSRDVSKKMCSENIQQPHRRIPIPKGFFNKVALQLYLNRTSIWVFSCKFAAYFQNTFS